MTTPTATRSFVLDREMPCSPASIWRALTVPALVEQWLMKNDFAPVAGHRFTFRATPMPHWNGVTDCEVVAVDPPARLAYSWSASGEEAATGIKTIVTWSLTPVGSGTRVRLEQSGFRSEDERGYQGAAYGWPKFLEGLERVAQRV
jgi:uncharacterized protein YndB with AHSA1/START domain